ncbi:MAG: ABC transporter permease [Anaerolineaceae bacterium]|nr:MAG: ABC transporter permease [Anaerolineaceae bacterium]HRQ32093.1 ABC transporter permease subunit [Anaerolineales bacterium]
MRNIWIIAKREYNHYFISPIAYVVAVALLLLTGGYFSLMLFAANQSGSFGGFVPEISEVNNLFGFLLLLSIPALTMRVIADETRSGAIELLLTAPIRDFELIAGKWLGSFLFVLTLISVTLFYLIILSSQVTPHPDWKLAASSYIGLILLAGALIALGVGISAIFSNQVTAFIATFGLFIFLWWLIGAPASLFPVGGDFFTYMTINAHFGDTLSQGNFYLTDLTYFLSLIAIGLFTGTLAIEIRRWK